MNYNKYGEVINGKYTCYGIANELKEGDSVGIGWTDEESTHLDIIFTLGINKAGCFQRGIQSNYLFVSIIDYTSFGFNASTIKDNSYIKEKIRMDNECGDKVADLINGIIKELNK